jgi:hypothetical protein
MSQSTTSHSTTSRSYMQRYVTSYTPFYILLHPGLARRLAYSEYTRARARTQRTTINNSNTPTAPTVTISTLSSVSTQDEYNDYAEYMDTINEQCNNQNNLRDLLLNTTIIINKEEGLCCAICQDDILQDTEIIRKLECTHIYHIHCIDKWLVLKMECPMCKSKI